MDVDMLEGVNSAQTIAKVNDGLADVGRHLALMKELKSDRAECYKCARAHLDRSQKAIGEADEALAHASMEAEGFLNDSGEGLCWEGGRAVGVVRMEVSKAGKEIVVVFKELRVYNAALKVTLKVIALIKGVGIAIHQEQTAGVL